MKTDLFQSCGHCWVFQICWHIVCSTFKASSFRIWNSSTGIPSPPLVLFVVMLSKSHLTSHSRMSGSRWVCVITPSWLSGSWRSFLSPSIAPLEKLNRSFLFPPLSISLTLSLCLTVWAEAICFPALGLYLQHSWFSDLRLRLALKPPAFLYLQLTDSKPWDFPASNTMRANSLY